MNAFQINPKTNIKYIHLQVSDLKQSLEFYTTGFGLIQAPKNNDAVLLKSKENTTRVLLTENPHAIPRPQATTGLYHVAFLFASRADLASAYRNMLNMGFQFDGFADHGVSEALHLTDPDGIGIELYADKPRDKWPIQDGHLHMGTWDLDIQSLMELATLRKPDADIKIGHVHLTVSDLAKTEYFYTTILGLHVVQRSLPGAIFVAANEYHHHIGANVWQGVGIPAAPVNSIGLKEFALELAGTDALNDLKNHLLDLHYTFLTDGPDILITDPDGFEIKIICSK